MGWIELVEWVGLNWLSGLGWIEVVEWVGLNWLGGLD